jgi:diaminohydroxyphosphoribosylaminopyrimidine deaminase/5-amino-6-(5-phosphoribosylamino)uracil reductase
MKPWTHLREHMEAERFILKEIRNVAGFDLPSDWLSRTTSGSKKWMGRTGVFPRIASAAYRGDALVAIAEPGTMVSSLLCLLKQAQDLTGSLVVTPIEPNVSEAEEVASLAKKKGVHAVVFGALHPSPTLRGQTVSKLKNRKLSVFNLAHDAVVSEVDRRFWVWASHGRSYVHLKISLSSEGMVVPTLGQKSHMAGSESKKRIHRLRGIYDGLLVGAATVRMYNSQMTYRGDETLPQPKKIILSKSGVFAPGLPAFEGERPIVTAETDMLRLTTELGEKNITSILVEGGYRVYQWFIEQSIHDEVSLVWTNVKGSSNGLMLPGRLPYGSLRVVGDDLWENIRWPASIYERKNPNHQ